MLGKWDKYILYFSTGHLSAQIKGVPGRQTDRQTDGHIGREKVCQADTQTGRHIGREKDCQAEGQAYR
jgi:hypothetical protein